MSVYLGNTKVGISSSIYDSYTQDIENAIRSKTGKDGVILISEMANEINSIPVAPTSFVFNVTSSSDVSTYIEVDKLRDIDEPTIVKLNGLEVNKITTFGTQSTSLTLPGNEVSVVEVSGGRLRITRITPNPNTLKSVNIGINVIGVSDLAFANCPNLSFITVSPENQYLDSRDNCNSIIETNINTLIRGCKNSNIPNSITSIGARAFLNCNTLTSITIPSSITNIGDFAFSYGTGSMSLEEITFMHTVSDSLTFGTKVFNVKTARSMTVNYYGNTAVANYNYSGDNITATLNLLS